MIIVTGASGHLGRTIVEKLLARIPASRVGVSVREPSKAKDLEALGVRIRHGDFNDPHSLLSAFEGAEKIVIVSSNARASGGDPLAQHRAAIDAAGKVGVTRIFYTSHMAVSSDSAFPPMHDHAITEAMLAESGIAWTALRNGFYGASGIAMMGNAMDSGMLETPRDGKFSWAAHADLAEAAVILLTGATMYNGPTPPLTGSQALDFGDLAEIASEVRGKLIQRTILSDEQMREKIAARGTPAHVTAIVMGLYIAARNGEFAAIDPTLQTLLGRPLLTMRELMAKE